MVIAHNCCQPANWSLSKFLFSNVERQKIRPKQTRMAQSRGEIARLPLMWPGFDSCPVPHVGWVCCWFSTLLRGFFSGFSGFLPSAKSTPNFNREPAWKSRLWLMSLPLKILWSNLLFILLRMKKSKNGFWMTYHLWRRTKFRDHQASYRLCFLCQREKY